MLFNMLYIYIYIYISYHLITFVLEYDVCAEEMIAHIMTTLCW
jgi:hypothetical protein